MSGLPHGGLGIFPATMTVQLLAAGRVAILMGSPPVRGYASPAVGDRAGGIASNKLGGRDERKTSAKSGVAASGNARLSTALVNRSLW